MKVKGLALKWPWLWRRGLLSIGRRADVVAIERGRARWVKRPLRARCSGGVGGHVGMPRWRRLTRGARLRYTLSWARVTDVAKRRRQGLVVCRAALPFEGLFDARPGVALAPALFACVA
jgi:hypothetical protein